MAYSRFYDSDIYIYPHVNGHIECAACLLMKVSFCIGNDRDLKAHIQAHISAGHNVPDGLVEEILADLNRYGKVKKLRGGK